MQNEIKIGKSLLETITVALYENPIILFREYVQNSLDAYNRAIKEEGQKKIDNFGVTIDIDHKERKIIIRDNGYAIEPKKFSEKMLSIAASEKDEDRTKYIGFRGIGRISGLPFCNSLIFKSKTNNSSEIDICEWKGDVYNRLLGEQSKDDLQDTIKKIVKIDSIIEKNTDPSEHYFEVVIVEYNNELEELISNNNFKKKLSRMLPLKYSPDFTKANLIIDQYKEFMKEDLERFMIAIRYDGEELFKSYTDDYLLDSNIVFWELREKRTKSGGLGDKIGLLWFTFPRRFKSAKDEDYFGILVRSKNMLMGRNETFAMIVDEYGDYITTYSEMVGALRAIYGELLINSANLKDNARRDWFRYDIHAKNLNYIIYDFMHRLHNYRYTASRYYRKNASFEKENLIKALDELVDLKKNDIDFESFYKDEEEKQIKKSTDEKDLTISSKKDETYANQDIPNQSIIFKRIYNKIMEIIKEFYEKDKKYDMFLKLRAYLSKKLGRS